MVANLAPRKMKFGLSEGMVLAASHSRREGQPGPVHARAAWPAPSRACASAEPRDDMARHRPRVSRTRALVRPTARRAASRRASRDGKVLSFPRLPFVLGEARAAFLDQRWADGRRPRTSRCAGRPASCAAPPATADDLAALRRMIVRYAEQSEAFVLRLFPHYRGHLHARQQLVPADRGDGPPTQLAQGRHAAAHRRVPVEPDARHAPAARLQQRQPGRPAARVAGRRAVRGRMRGATCRRSASPCPAPRCCCTPAASRSGDAPATTI